MKKLLYCAAALATLLFAGSCQKENLEPVENGQTISYTVQLPDVINTKALGDDITNVDDLYYEVWRTSAEETIVFTDADNRLYHKSVANAFDDSGKATIEFQLINNQNFTVLFWADVPGNGIYTVTDLTNVTVAQNGDSNQEKYAAFSGHDFIKSDETKLTGRTVELKRAVAQLNIATTPESLTQFDDAITLKQSKVTVNGLSTSFNVATQEAGDISTADYVYALQNVPSGSVTVGTDNYTYIAMNYVGFAKKTGSTIDVEYEFTTSEGTISNEIPNVPVKANYRTNIIGNLISSSSSYTVTLDDDWGDDNSTSGNIEVINGGIVKNQNGDYEITNEEGFAYAVNKLFENGGTFYILNNLNMGGYTLGTVILPNTKTLNLIGEKPVVTRASSTGSTTGITITGLTQPLIAEVREGATASFSNIVVDDYKGPDTSAALVGENDGKVVVSGCEATDASNDEVDLVGDSNNNGNVVDASDAANGGGLAYLQYMLGTNVSTITLSSPVVIPAGETVELDLEGKTVTYTTTDQNDHMFTNNGNLTLKGNGSIEFIYAGANDSNYGKGNYAIINGGTLTINGPTVSVSVNGVGENVKFSHALYAVHNSGVMTLDNGKIINDNNIAIRQWIGSEVNPSTITINGGEVYGLRAIWMQLPNNDSSKAPKGNLNVIGGTLSAWENAAEYDSSNKLAIYSYSYGNAMKNVNINISGGTFNGDIALTGGRSDAKVDTESLTITGGTFNGLWGDVYSYANDAEAAKTIKITGGEFSSIYPLVYLDSENEVIKMADDFNYESESESTPYVTFNGTGTLDLNGKTITGVDNTNKNYSIIDNRGNLTVKNGTMKLSATVESGWNRASSVISNNPGGNLTVESDAVIEHLGGTSMAYGIDNLTNGKGTTAITTINGATVKSKYIAVRQFLNGVDATNELYVNSGKLDGKYTIYFQDPSVNANTGKLVVAEAAELYSSVYLDVTEGSTEWPVSVTIADAALKNGAKVVSANVPEGYAVELKNGNWVCTSNIVSNTDELKAAVAEGYTTISLKAGTYDTKDFQFMNKTLSLKGIEEGVVIYNSQNNDVACTSFDCCVVTFENLTIKTLGGLYKGFARMEGTYKDCTFENCYFTCYGKHLFENCTFNAPTLTGSFQNEHCVWTYGAAEVDFVECEFNYSDRCVNVYVDNGGNAPGITSDVEFSKCEFITENTSSEGAVEINSAPFTAGVTVALTDCTAPAYGEMVYVSPWDGTKGATATITVNGVAL